MDSRFFLVVGLMNFSIWCWVFNFFADVGVVVHDLHVIFLIGFVQGCVLIVELGFADVGVVFLGEGLVVGRGILDVAYVVRVIGLQ